MGREITSRKAKRGSVRKESKETSSSAPTSGKRICRCFIAFFSTIFIFIFDFFSLESDDIYAGVYSSV